MGNNRARSSTRVNLRTPCVFIIYINYLPPTINTLVIPITFADDTSVVITSENLDEFGRLANAVVSYMSKWFTANKLALNLDKTNTIKFTTNNALQCLLSTGYDNYLEESVHTKFLGLLIDNHLNWKSHIDQLVSKLITACYAIRTLLHISNSDTLKTIYFAYFHSLMRYGIIFWVIRLTARGY
jgi:hypothetical protein